MPFNSNSLTLLASFLVLNTKTDDLSTPLLHVLVDYLQCFICDVLA